MSAFLCNPEHIGRLVRFYINRDRHHTVTPEWAAKMLATANLASVGDRYRLTPDAAALEFQDAHSAESYTAACVNAAQRLDHGLTPVMVLKMAQCLDYQSCEVDGWLSTEAYGLIERIKSAAIAALPGYDEAPWEYTFPAKGAA